MFIKNISTNVVNLDDIGFSLQPGEVLNLADLDSTEIASSSDISNNINLGNIVYLSDDGVTELSVQESIDLQSSNNQGIDLSEYAKISDVIKLISQVDNSMIDDIVKFPVFVARYDRLKYGEVDHTGSSDFYERLSVPYYVNKPVLTKQVVADVTGNGIFTGLFLPTLEVKRGTNRSVTVIITVDGVITSETYYYSNKFDDRLRLFIGSAYSTLKWVEEEANDLVLTGSDDNDDKLYTNRRPQYIPKASSNGGIIIPNPMVFLNDLSKPRIKFENSLKVEYVISDTLMFENSNYKNRAVAFYLLGEF